jgi:hypothetical protein
VLLKDAAAAGAAAAAARVVASLTHSAYEAHKDYSATLKFTQLEPTIAA